MGLTVLLDTNIVLYHLADQLLRGLSPGNFAVSVITEIELLSFPNLKLQEESNIRQFLTDVTVIPLSRSIVERAISLRKTHRLKLPDAIILATAVVKGFEFLSNDRQFAQIPEIRVGSVPIKLT